MPNLDVAIALDPLAIQRRAGEKRGDDWVYYSYYLKVGFRQPGLREDSGVQIAMEKELIAKLYSLFDLSERVDRIEQKLGEVKSCSCSHLPTEATPLVTSFTFAGSPMDTPLPFEGTSLVVSSTTSCTTAPPKRSKAPRRKKPR